MEHTQAPRTHLVFGMKQSILFAHKSPMRAVMVFRVVLVVGAAFSPVK